MELIVLNLVIAALTIGAIVIGVMPNWFVTTLVVLAVLPRLLWSFVTGSAWKSPYFILSKAIKGCRRELEALGVTVRRVTVTERWGKRNTTPPLDVILWLVFESDAAVESACTQRDDVQRLLRSCLLARGWSEKQLADLLIGFVTEQEIEARGGGFHFSREGYKPDALGRVGSAA